MTDFKFSIIVGLLFGIFCGLARIHSVLDEILHAMPSVLTGG